MAENGPVSVEPAPITGAAIPKKPRGLVLRLDNGTIISNREDITKGAYAAVCLKPEEALEAGMLSEAHLLKAQALLCEVHAKLPEEGPLKSLSSGSKRSADTAFQTTAGPSNHQEGAAFNAGTALDTAATTPTPFSAPTPQAPVGGVPTDWTQTAEQIINKVLLALGPSVYIFRDPVNAAVVPDYYQIITKPICWKDILDKLHAKSYASPVEFYNDADLLYQNCFTYNKVGSDVRALGEKSERKFEDEWAKTPFASLVAPKPRKPRGRAPMASGLPRKPSGAGRGRGAGRGGGPGRRPPGRPPGAVARPKALAPYKSFQQLSPDKINQLAQTLNDPVIMEQKLNGIVDILRQNNELPTNEAGEVELDLQACSPHVLYALYEYVFGPGTAASVNPAPSSVGPTRSGRLGEGDSDYDPMDEDDDE